MTDRELEQRLARALDHAAPDDLEGVLSRCKQGKGALIEMEHTSNKTNRRKNWSIGLIAACLALVLLAGSGIFYRQTYAVAAVISLDVNPSIELRVNNRERVLSCAALNDDAAAVLSDMGGGADLEGTKLDVAVNAIVGALLRNGYLDSISSAILISVEDDNADRGARLQQELVATVDGALQSAASQAAVYSQNMTSDGLNGLEGQTGNISSGKAALVRRVMELSGSQDAALFEQLSALSVEELMDLLETGETRVPIGTDTARQAAEQYVQSTLGLTGLTVHEVDPELDELLPCYQVEFTGQYELECAVDAFTGEILSCEYDGGHHDDSHHGGIDGDDAFDRAAAYFHQHHPELAGYNLLDRRTLLSSDGSRYNVYFTCGGSGWTTEVDASTGEVLSLDEMCTGLPVAPSEEPSVSPSPEPSPSTSPSLADIGADQAKAIALADAGLTWDQVTRLKVERDWDNGRLEYEVDFLCDATEYDYTIDGATGAILKRETEPASGQPAPSTEPSPTPTPSAQPADIGEDAAKAAGLARAGITDAGSVTWVKCQREYDDGRLQYDMEFECGSTVHECEILAADGTVLSYDCEPCDNVLHHHDEEHHDEDHHSGTTDIGSDAAKTAALDRAGLTEAQVTGLKAERDWDDGQLEYEVEFFCDSTEYDVTVDGTTGAILKYETEPVRDGQPAPSPSASPAPSSNPSPSPSGSADIGADEAKAIALAHAGLSESQVTGLHVGRDWDDGRLEYEVEFKYNGIEYEYTIDGATGAILDYDWDN